MPDGADCGKPIRHPGSSKAARGTEEGKSTAGQSVWMIEIGDGYTGYRCPICYSFGGFKPRARCPHCDAELRCEKQNQ